MPPPPPSWTKGRTASGSPKECVWRVARKKESVKRALTEREDVMFALPEREALFFFDGLIKGLCTHKVSETARARALNGAEGRSPRALTLRKRQGGQFHSHYGESFWGLHLNKSHRTIYSHFYCVRILSCPLGRAGCTPASHAGQPTPPLQKRGGIAISFNGESFGGIGTSICNGLHSLHSCCFYDIFFLRSTQCNG